MTEARQSKSIAMPTLREMLRRHPGGRCNKAGERHFSEVVPFIHPCSGPIEQSVAEEVRRFERRRIGFRTLRPVAGTGCEDRCAPAALLPA